MKRKLLSLKGNIESKFLAFIAPFYVVVQQKNFAMADAIVDAANQASDSIYTTIKSISGKVTLVSVALALLIGIVPGVSDDAMKGTRKVCRWIFFAWVAILLAPTFITWGEGILKTITG